VGEEGSGIGFGSLCGGVGSGGIVGSGAAFAWIDTNKIPAANPIVDRNIMVTSWSIAPYYLSFCIVRLTCGLRPRWLAAQLKSLG
jgi:hypothetical protein